MKGKLAQAASLRFLGEQKGTFTALILLIITLSFLSPQFLSSDNFLNILLQISNIAIIATGMTFVILTGGIDLSVGSIVALTGLIMAALMKYFNLPTLLAISLGVLSASFMGWINGVLIARIKVPPFIATLGMMSIARGGAYTISGGKPIYSLPVDFNAIAGRWGFFPVPAILMLIVFAIGWYILTQTKLGRYVYAIGGNENASTLSGINVKRYIQIVYVISGLTCALASIILTARLDSAVPVAGEGSELDAIAAVVIGGTSMTGGQGSIIGTFIGALIMGVVSNGLNLLIVPQGMQRVVKGVIIVAAVVIDILRKKKKV